MNRLRSLLLAAVAASVLLLGAASISEARPFYRGGGYSYYHPTYYNGYHYGYNHMPGWDWRYTYPYSNYNAWRNPYGYYPYTPYVYPNVVYGPGYVSTPPVTAGTYYSGYSGNPAPDGTPSEPAHAVMVPHPTGQLRAAPPNAGVIQVRLPDEFGTVLFDGQKSSSVGTTRYYVTPELAGGKDHTYDISATFNRNGESVTENRQIAVAPGRTTIVDFNRAVGK